jgi:hypothetical protein
MPRYMVYHTLIKTPEQVNAWWGQASPVFAEANKLGKFPAKCLYTWIPTDLAEHSQAYCLWEADGLEQVRGSITATGIAEYMTVDVMEIGETDWLA